MIELKNHYENSKKRATLFMEKGQISAYFKALLEMNHYKRLMVAVARN
tara:strand:- start:231937 stop:232080 length:144 start_codon:yes stop_codon:yes gene_type:complete